MGSHATLRSCANFPVDFREAEGRQKVRCARRCLAWTQRMACGPAERCGDPANLLTGAAARELQATAESLLQDCLTLRLMVQCGTGCSDGIFTRCY